MNTTDIPLPEQKYKGWILYDGSCGFCRRWVPFWEETLKKRGFGIAPLQADWVISRLNVREAVLLDDLRLLLASGEIIVGADAYRFAMKRIWWAYPLYIFAITPVLRNVFDWGYRTFAANRYHVSRACGLEGK